MSRGADGDCPDWYLTLKASERLHGPPWLMDDEAPAPPIIWKWRAIAALTAESRAMQIERERHEAEAKERERVARRDDSLMRARKRR